MFSPGFVMPAAVIFISIASAGDAFDLPRSRGQCSAKCRSLKMSSSSSDAASDVVGLVTMSTCEPFDDSSGRRVGSETLLEGPQFKQRSVFPLMLALGALFQSVSMTFFLHIAASEDVHHLPARLPGRGGGGGHM